ncbi:MAG TPA: M4 family metallopeptidase [Polyangia bacterium]
MKSWGILGAFALVACSGHTITTTPSAPARAELHVAPAFAPIGATKDDPIDASIAFVQAQHGILGLDAKAAFSVIRREITADGLNHVRLQQTYDGVPVWGSDIVVHSNGDSVTGVDGTLLGSLSGLDLAPSIADTTAATIAQSNYLKSARNAAVVRWSRQSSELVVLPVASGAARLAWHVIFATDGTAGPAGIWNYFVDAHDGSIVDMFNNLQTATVEASGPGGNNRVTRTWNMNLDVTQSGSNYIMNTSQYQTTNAKTGQDYSGTSLTNYNATDKAANDGHGFAEITIKMLKDWQGYNSIDNKGLVLVSNIHAGQSLGTEDNAAWDGSSMNYGDGDGTQFFNFTGALDVIAHEIDHGFTQYHSNLTYSGQSGGMNESFSDIAGTAAKFYYDAKTADFNLGADIFVAANTYIRYMCKPSMDGMSLDNASQYDSQNPQDVHYTSGVMNKAFCRAAKRLSGADPDTGTATVDGVKKASKAFYEANASHWTASTTWTSGCQGVVDAATALMYSPLDISGLGDSWKDVGVTCNYTHVNGFGMSMTPATATVMAGNSATFMIATTVGAGNTAQSVTLSATGLPTGVTATFNPASVMTGSSSTLTIQTAYDTAIGDIKFTVKAAGASMATQSADGTLTVTAPPPDMTTIPPDMADNGGNGGNGGSGGGNGNHGGDSGCSYAGAGAAASSTGALLLVLVAAALLFRRRVD